MSDWPPALIESLINVALRKPHDVVALLDAAVAWKDENGRAALAGRTAWDTACDLNDELRARVGALEAALRAAGLTVP